MRKKITYIFEILDCHALMIPSGFHCASFPARKHIRCFGHVHPHCSPLSHQNLESASTLPALPWNWQDFSISEAVLQRTLLAPFYKIVRQFLLNMSLPSARLGPSGGQVSPHFSNQNLMLCQWSGPSPEVRYLRKQRCPHTWIFSNLIHRGCHQSGLQPFHGQESTLCSVNTGEASTRYSIS